MFKTWDCTSRLTTMSRINTDREVALNLFMQVLDSATKAREEQHSTANAPYEAAKNVEKGIIKQNPA